MALYCLASPGGSPGVTTTALGLALTWPEPVLLAECDPMGRCVLPGFGADRLATPAGQGILGLALAAQAGGPARLPLEEFTVPLVDGGLVDLLHGLRDPRHAPQLAALWRPLADALRDRGGDVIADLGRIGGPETPAELLRHADAVVMVLRPTLVRIDAARPRMEALKELVSARVGLCLVGEGAYGVGEIERALGAPVLKVLPDAPADARVLSDGAAPRATFQASLLVRSLKLFGRRLRSITRAPSATGEVVALAGSAGRS